nr:hypothetical protein [Tanacetum cinerariifolium]
MASFDYRLNPLYPIKECSSCGALYTTDYCCSNGSLGDKIICDLDKTPDLFQEPLRIILNSSDPSNDNTNVVNTLQEPFIVKQDPSKNSSQSPPQINHHCCYGCGNSLEGIFCHQCTCELCGNGAHYGYNCPPKVSIILDPKPFNNHTIDELPQTLPSFDPTCCFEDGNSFTYDSTSNLVHDYPNIFNPPLQPLLYSCEFCRNDARYGHYCTPQVLFIYPKLCYNQDFNFPQDFHDFQQQYLCCKNCEDPYEAYQCQPMNEDYYHEQNSCYDPNSFGVDQFQPSNNQSSSDEDIPKEIYSNPLFDEEIISMKIDPHQFNAEFDLIESMLNHDSLIISSSSKIDSLFDEFADELTLLKSIPLGIKETDCDPEEEIHLIKRLLYDNSSPRPPKEFISENSDTAFESFSLFPIPIEDNGYDSERDILILKELLSNDSPSLLENESFHVDIPSSSRPPAKPPDGNSGILNAKMMGDIFEHKVPMPRLMFTQTTLVPNQEKSPNLLSHQGHEALQPSTECPMMIYGKNTPILDVSFFHFYCLIDSSMGELGQAK